MDIAAQAELRARYIAAQNSFISKVSSDPNVIAIIISGSLAYDVIWEKSDIDMTMVVRDQSLATTTYCIDEDGILINVYLVVRSDFKRGMERALGGSFAQSYYSKGKMVYSTDDSLIEYFEDLKIIGSDDIAVSALHIASQLVFLRDKTRKWLTVRQDLLYAQYYLLKAAESVAHMELCIRGEAISREAIQRAQLLNPEVLAPLYQDAMSHHMSVAEIESGLECLDKVLERHLPIFSRPVLEFMRDQEIKTVTLINKHFHVQSDQLLGVMDYLVQQGILEKVTQTIRITPKSKPAVEEAGYLYIP
ncbi:nucleotidyltransferase [Paenibacillus helianthi]|uniref:Nucleotidyltransferase n=1 Tax=Paenibacillus helianthi TaxID=1349432 RepID=A0ABX3EGR9_9BACL|nr:nucleotidyltransferase [Paenibacillus helianthi]OKP81805.1 nucleotidyltransferase [Paenibacillus helianthi]